MANVQTKNGEEAIKMQKEIAEMQKKQKLFYESQLEWANETRKLIAKFVSDGFRLNIVVDDIKEMDSKINKGDFQIDEKEELLKQVADNTQEIRNLIINLNEEITLIRLYLFHKKDVDEMRILSSILLIEDNINADSGIDSKLLSQFVDTVRDYFDKLMKKLKEESA